MQWPQAQQKMEPDDIPVAVIVSSTTSEGNGEREPAGRGFFYRLIQAYSRCSWLILLFWFCVVGVGAWSFPQCLERFNSKVRSFPRVTRRTVCIMPQTTSEMHHYRDATFYINLQLSAVSGSESDIAKQKLDQVFPATTTPYEVDVVRMYHASQFSERYLGEAERPPRPPLGSWPSACTQVVASPAFATRLVPLTPARLPQALWPKDIVLGTNITSALVLPLLEQTTFAIVNFTKSYPVITKTECAPACFALLPVFYVPRRRSTGTAALSR